MLLPVLVPSPAGAQLYGFPSGVGVLDDGYGALPPTGPSLPGAGLPEGASASPPALVVAPPAPPPCPLVIKVGRGLQRPVRPRIVYGGPSPCL